MHIHNCVVTAGDGETRAWCGEVRGCIMVWSPAWRWRNTSVYGLRDEPGNSVGEDPKLDWWYFHSELLKLAGLDRAWSLLILISEGPRVLWGVADYRKYPVNFIRDEHRMATDQESLVHPVHPTSAYPTFLYQTQTVLVTRIRPLLTACAPVCLLCEFSGKGSIHEWRSHRSAKMWALMCVSQQIPNPSFHIL